MKGRTKVDAVFLHARYGTTVGIWNLNTGADTAATSELAFVVA